MHAVPSYAQREGQARCAHGDVGAVMQPAVARWLAALTQALDEGESVAASHHRVIHPRGLPLNGDGLVRHQAIGPVERPGLPPEYMALMSFSVPSEEQYGLQHGDLARGLGALITFMINRRVDVLAEVPLRMEDVPDVATFMPLNGIPDRALLAPMEIDQSRLDQLMREHLALIAGLPERDSEVIGAALDMHYGACLLFDRDLASAYTLLVAGLEAMSRRFGQPPTDWLAWDQAAQWDRFAEDEGLTAGQAQALRDRLMRDHQLRLNETLATYASSALPDSFWEGEWRDWTYALELPKGIFTGGSWQPGRPVEQLVPRDRDTLKAMLRRSYTARSGFVHSGDRIGDVTAELIRTVSGPSPKERLSFPALRLILRALIDHELRLRTTGDGTVPELVMTLDPPKTAATPAQSWSTPPPGALTKRHRRH